MFLSLQFLCDAITRIGLCYHDHNQAIELFISTKTLYVTYPFRVTPASLSFHIPVTIMFLITIILSFWYKLNILSM